MTSPFDEAEVRRMQAAGRAAHYQRWENGQLQPGAIEGPYSQEQIRAMAMAQLQPRVYDSSDALLGELLREVLSMAKAMEGLRGEVADLRAEIRNRAQTQVAFPGSALRHGNPR